MSDNAADPSKFLSDNAEFIAWVRDIVEELRLRRKKPKTLLYFPNNRPPK